MKKETLTKEKWQNFVKINSLNTYNFIVCFLILHLWEMGVETREQAEKALHDTSEAKNITGFQAENIINAVINNKPGWKLDMDNDEEIKTNEQPIAQ